MNICVAGLGHLGCVTASALSSVATFRVVGLDSDDALVQKLQDGEPAIFESGMQELIQEGLRSGRLSFTSEASRVLGGCDLVWVTFDTPIDACASGNVPWVMDQVVRMFPYLKNGIHVLISSQVPVGTTSQIASLFREAFPHRQVTFCYSPENLRVGDAIHSFTQPERVVIGAPAEAGRELLRSVFLPFSDRIIWMGVESAEMTKHALNTFLAVSVSFINEITALCEPVGADSAEVSQGLRSDSRVGPHAYVRPGDAFSGGTLARDVVFLNRLAKQHGLDCRLLKKILASNEAHRRWLKNRFRHVFKVLSGKRILLFGLAPKPGSNLLRQSGTLLMAEWLVARKAEVRAYDPWVKVLPQEVASILKLVPSLEVGLKGADALAIFTDGEALKALTGDQLRAWMRSPVVFDPNRLVKSELASDERIQYVTIGRPL